MKAHVTIVPIDQLVIVDNQALQFEYPFPEGMHALQWHNGAGHTEWTNDANKLLTIDDYESAVAPFVDLWQIEYDRLEEIANQPPEPEIPLPPPTLAEAKATKLTEINTACDATLSALTGGYPYSELLTFDKQEAEARAYLVDPTAPTPLLTALAEGRKIPMADLVAKVIAKADAFASASGYVIGQRQALEDQIDAATTVEEVQSIEVKLVYPSK